MTTQSYDACAASDFVVGSNGAGGLWALVAGSELTVLSESGAQSFFDGAPRLSLDGGAIVARDQAGHAMRVGRGGLVERSAPSTRWER